MLDPYHLHNNSLIRRLEAEESLVARISIGRRD